MKPLSGLELPIPGRAAKLARGLLASALIVGSGSAVAAGSNDPPTAQSTQTQAPTPAKWVPRKLRFSYVGFTSHYTCDGLRDQMKWILQQLGAGDDLLVKSRGCTHLQGPEPFPGVDATFSVLEPAPGAQPSAANAQSVPARWDAVTLDSDTSRRTSNAGGCELIEQVKKHVLPLFTTRNLTYSSDCFPHTTTLVGARLSAEVLRPVKPPTPTAGNPQ